MTYSFKVVTDEKDAEGLEFLWTKAATIHFKRIKNRHGLYMGLMYEDDLIVGIVIGRKSVDILHIEYIEVKKDFRCKGIGTQLMNEFIKYTKPNYVTGIIDATNEAYSFWESYHQLFYQTVDLGELEDEELPYDSFDYDLEINIEHPLQYL